MNFFKRALASITRRKGKSLILFAVIFILGNVMAGAIAIEQGTKSVESTIKRKLGSVATITEDQDKIQEESLNNPNIYEDIKTPTQKTLEEIGKLDEVNYYDYSITDYLNTEKFVSAQLEESGIIQGEGATHFFRFKGVNYNEVLDIKNKIIQLEDGRVFDKNEIKKGSNVVLISEEVAKANNAKVGDKITIDNTTNSGAVMIDADNKEVELEVVQKDYQMEVIGIFKVIQSEKKDGKKDSEQAMMNESNYLDRVNTIYAPNNYVTKVMKEFHALDFEKNPSSWGDMSKEEFEEMMDSSNSGVSTFTLKSPEAAEDFRIKVNKILQEEGNKYSKVLVSSDQYEQVAGPVKGMSKISKLVLIISILASILIITLVTILFLRDRKHELGIYLSLGEKRIKVIGQIVIEVVIIAFVAITISVFTGNMLAKGFSNSLIKTQKTQETADNMYNYSPDSWMYSQLTSNEVSEDDVIEAYQISLNAHYILLFYVVGIGVVLVSTVAPLIYIMRLNPKKIMM